jgi:hypothetical protein
MPALPGAAARVPDVFVFRYVSAATVPGAGCRQVSDKPRANFCGYFQANPRACSGSSDQAVDSRTQLAALFGDGTAGDGAETSSSEDGLRKQLEQWYGK